MTPALQPGTERPNIASVTRLLLALAATFAFPLAAFSQPYPSQPVRVMVGFPPGGTTDIIGRLTANELSEQLAKPFVVHNRGAPSGIIGAARAAQRPPDGHSLLLAPR